MFNLHGRSSFLSSSSSSSSFVLHEEHRVSSSSEEEDIKTKIKVRQNDDEDLFGSSWRNSLYLSS